MNKIDNSGEGIARLGRNEDSMLAHVAPGEMVVPPVISPLTQQAIQQEMMAVGLDPNEYTVGQGMSINPITGMAEFGFLKKLGKKLKKVVKKVAPIVVPALGIAGFAGAGPLAGFLGKGAAKATTGKIFGAGGKFRAGLSGFFNPAKDAIGIAGGKLGPNIRRGIGSFFQPGQMQAGVEQQMDPSGGFIPTSYGAPNYQLSQEEMRYITENFTPMGESGLFRGPDGQGYTPDQIVAGLRATQPQSQQAGLGFNLFGGTPGQSRLGLIEDFFKGKKSDPVRDGGSFFGFDTPGPVKGIEDVIKGQQTGDSRGGLAALAALYGLATKRAAEDRVGGLRDIRASRRPDLAPQPVFQGFDLGVRPGMAYGGTAMGRPGFANGGPLNPDLFELDYRQVGGPTIGIGTGTSDDIPAMLSDGEYVFTASANNGAGAFDISKSKDSIMLTPDGKPNREKGAKNLGMLMDMFEDIDKRLS